MTEKNYARLCDFILQALNLSIDQKDAAISDLLSRALEMSMTRNAGGRDFIERRDMSDEIEKALGRLDALKRSVKGQ